MVVRLSGSFSDEQLKTAMATVYANNESTLSKIVLEENGEAYYETMAESGCKIYFDSRDYKEIIQECEKKPYALWDGELIRTFINHQEKETTILIMSHHLAGDGKSMILLIEEFLKVLSGEHIEYQPLQLVDEEMLAKKSPLKWTIRQFLRQTNKKWEREGRGFSWEDYLNIHQTYWKGTHSEIIIEEHNADELHKMKECCTHGITLNSYLVTYLLNKFPDCKGVGIPVNIREHNRSMSNQTSGIAMKHKYEPDKSFKENLIKVDQKIKKQLHNDKTKYFILKFLTYLSPSLIDAVLLESHGCYSSSISHKLAKSMDYTDESDRDLGITNLTTIQIPEQYPAFHVQGILFIPPKVSYAKRIIGISTYHDKLTITYHQMADEAPQRVNM
jgi:NRPS condensation-like uncharacterized protein